jgi:hypothetical protein
VERGDCYEDGLRISYLRGREPLAFISGGEPMHSYRSRREERKGKASTYASSFTIPSFIASSI